ncbi:hypothetical protein [Pseudomonas sp. PCH199]|uniref:hypothetical protein n=1 Tax=unclassified Pseudomonas TaxID=196821 RepID=UPI0026B6E597|nr:hypothetical protein [Pseudomonas sp. PCH199]
MQTISVFFRRLHWRTADSIAPTTPHNLLRWFSLISFILISAIAIGLGTVATRFLVMESLERDALLSAQFIQTIANVEIRHHQLTGMRMGDVLATTQYGMLSQEMAQKRHRARAEFLDHLSQLPDSLLINIYSPLRTVMWSTNAQLIGQKLLNDAALEAAFSSKERVSTQYSNADKRRPEQLFCSLPKCSSSRATSPW